MDPTRYQVRLDTTAGAVTLRVKITPEYPLCLPELEITSDSHKIVVQDLLKAVLKEVRHRVPVHMLIYIIVGARTVGDGDDL